MSDETSSKAPAKEKAEQHPKDDISNSVELYSDDKNLFDIVIEFEPYEEETAQ